MNTHPLPPPIRPARPHDVAAITALLVESLTDDPVAQWLVPDPRIRTDVFHRLLSMQVDQAVEWGHVDVLLDASAVAVWRPHPASHGAALAAHHLNPAIPKTLLPRFAQLHALMGSCASDAPHHWLAWLHVAPASRGRGFGAGLLGRHHRRVDRKGWPIYAVVTTETARDFLHAHGYHPGLPLHLPDGPTLWPLDRSPYATNRPRPSARVGEEPAPRWA
ncbi:hypothetical protein ACIA59_28795 [Micromonospora haikouensis]|uniref:hypothetical protein n=1 Tax=Micromonospora haikouensis TaxID=686309 RepID=UPI0037B25A6F